MKLLCIIVGLFAVTFCKGQISHAMEEFIKRNEGLSVEVYIDGSHIVVSYVITSVFLGMEWVRDIKPGMEISEELAELLFRYDMLYLVNPG